MITGKRKENLAADLVVRSHHVIAGLSEKNGGQDEGPNPHELLEMALAACSILTAQMYANRKGIKLTNTNAVVKILSEGEETKISREVSFEGDLTEAEKKRLTEIIEKCPIHNLLESKVTIETTVKE